MTPGEIRTANDTLALNEGRPSTEVEVRSRSRWPVGVGSHFHFFEVNRALAFDREAAYGMRLDAPAGSITWFEPDETRTVRLVALAGARETWGFNGLVNGSLEARRGDALRSAAEQGFAR